MHLVLFISGTLRPRRSSSTSQTELVSSEWIKSFGNFYADAAIVIIVRNKVDLPDRLVQPEEAKTWAKASDAFYVETSTKTGQRVKVLFDQFVTTLTPIVAAAKGTTTSRTRIIRKRKVIVSEPARFPLKRSRRMEIASKSLNYRRLNFFSCLPSFF
jgi:tRNA U34 5-carboxymethylaminomethyl modifying GTPase MnmE/TrmE